MNPYEKELAASQAYGRFMERRVAQLEDQIKHLLREKAAAAANTMAWGSTATTQQQQTAAANGGGGGSNSNNNNVDFDVSSTVSGAASMSQHQQQRSAAAASGGGGGRVRGSSMISNASASTGVAGGGGYGGGGNGSNYGGGATAAASTSNMVGDTNNSFSDNALVGLGSGVNVVEELIRLREENELLKQHYRLRVAEINTMRTDTDEATQREARLITVNEQLRSEMAEIREIMPTRLFGERPKDDRKTREILAHAAKIRQQYETELAALEESERLARLTGVPAIGAGNSKVDSSTDMSSPSSPHHLQSNNKNGTQYSNGGTFSLLSSIAAQQQQQQNAATPTQSPAAVGRQPNLKVGFKKVAQMFGSSACIIQFLQNETASQRARLMLLMQQTCSNAESMANASEAVGPTASAAHHGAEGVSTNTPNSRLESLRAGSLSPSKNGSSNAHNVDAKALAQLAATAISVPTDPNWRFENLLFYASTDDGVGRATQLLDSIRVSLDNIKASARAIDDTITSYNVAARHGVGVIVQAQSCSTADECAIVKKKAKEVIATLNSIRAMRREALEITKALLPHLAVQFRQASNALLGAMTRRIISPRVSRPIITQLELLSLKCQSFDTSTFITPEMLTIRVGAVEQVLLEVILGVKNSTDPITIKSDLVFANVEGLSGGEGDRTTLTAAAGTASEADRQSARSSSVTGGGLAYQQSATFSSSSQFFERMEVAEIRALSNDVVKPPLNPNGGDAVATATNGSAAADIASGFLSFADRCHTLLGAARDVVLGKTDDAAGDPASHVETNSKGTQYNFFFKRNDLSETERQYQELVHSFLDARSIEREAAEEVRSQALASRTAMQNAYGYNSTAAAPGGSGGTAAILPPWAAGAGGGGGSGVGGMRAVSPYAARLRATSPYTMTSSPRGVLAGAPGGGGAAMNIIMRERMEKIAAKKLQQASSSPQGRRGGAAAAGGGGGVGDDLLLGADDLEPYDPLGASVGTASPAPQRHGHRSAAGGVRRGVSPSVARGGGNASANATYVDAADDHHLESALADIMGPSGGGRRATTSRGYN